MLCDDLEQDAARFISELLWQWRRAARVLREATRVEAATAHGSVVMSG